MNKKYEIVFVILFSIAFIYLLSFWIQSSHSLLLTAQAFENAFGETTKEYVIEPLVSTRGNFNLTTGKLISEHSPIEYNASHIPGLQKDTCPSDSKVKDLEKGIIIYIHGYLVNGNTLGSEDASEIFDRVRKSINNNNNNYSIPNIGFNWDSEIASNKEKAWEIAKDVAKSNGLKLAQFILDFKNKCPTSDIRIIAHSLGSKIVLSSLDILNKNQEWNNKDFNITSVHLLGAAVDNEEISTNPFDIVKDPTNGYKINLFELESPVTLNGTKYAFGNAIENEVINFTNLYSSNDDSLEWFYPIAEKNDSALGQSGAEKNIRLPHNYKEINVTEHIEPLCNANGHNSCDFPYNAILGATAGIGDNHFGYIGFRNTNNKIIYDGALDVVVSDWRKQEQDNELMQR
jgi:hypothetical protein